jgi:FxLD family lantipeptide
MSTPTIEKQTTVASEKEAFDPFKLDITFIENTPAAETTLLCSTGDTCGSSCPSACTTS